MKETINRLIDRARIAQADFEKTGQEGYDNATLAVAWALIEPKRNETLSKLAVQTTHLGKVEDKITKNYRKTIGLLRDLKGIKTHGIIREIPEKGIIEIAGPIGVVAAVTPSTNPLATPVNNVINALKCGNAIIISPSPKGSRTLDALIVSIHTELKKVGLSTDLVQTLPSPVNKEASLELMQQADLIICTGSQNNVKTSFSSGTPAIGVGAGNVVSIVDESANLAKAANAIMRSKTFDNATSCSSENNLIILDKVYDDCLKELSQNGGVLLNASQKTTLQANLWKNGHLNRELIAQIASFIGKKCGLPFDEKTKFYMVEETGTGKEHPFSGEKLSPVLTVYRAKNFEEVKIIANNILDYQGKGHSLGVHTHNEEHILQLGLQMPVCRVIVNQAHCFATGGSFDNGLPFSLSMGCGSWGGNGISDNLNYKHFMNIKRIVKTIHENKVEIEDIFMDYFNQFGK